MLTVCGIIAIDKNDDIQLKEVSGGVMFRFTAVSADRKEGSGKYHYYKVSLFVPEKDVEEAMKLLQPRKVIQIHNGCWNANKYTFEGKEYQGNTLTLHWSGISVLGWFENRKKEG